MHDIRIRSNSEWKRTFLLINVSDDVSQNDIDRSSSERRQSETVVESSTSHLWIHTNQKAKFESSRLQGQCWEQTSFGKSFQHSWLSRKHRERGTRTARTFSRVPACATVLNHVENTSRRKQEATFFWRQDQSRTPNDFWFRHYTNWLYKIQYVDTNQITKTDFSPWTFERWNKRNTSQDESLLIREIVTTLAIKNVKVSLISETIYENAWDDDEESLASDEERNFKTRIDKVMFLSHHRSDISCYVNPHFQMSEEVEE